MKSINNTPSSIARFVVRFVVVPSTVVSTLCFAFLRPAYAGGTINAPQGTTESLNTGDLSSGNRSSYSPSNTNNNTSKAVGNIADLYAKQNQALTAQQKTALSNYFSSNPAAAATASTDPQQFLNSVQSLTGSGNSGSSLNQTINNPIPSDIATILSNLHPVDSHPVNVGIEAITTGVKDNCPAPVYTQNSWNQNYYLFSNAGSDTKLAEGQDTTLMLRNNCLRVELLKQVTQTEFKTQVASWLTLDPSVAIPLVQAQLFLQNDPASALKVDSLASAVDGNGKIVSTAAHNAVVFGVGAIFTNIQHLNAPKK